MANEVSTLTLGVDSRQVKGAASDLDRLSAAGKKAESAADSMRSAYAQLGSVVGPVAAAFSATKIIQAADAYANLASRISLASGSAAEFAVAQKSIFDISERTRTSLAGTADLYYRLSTSTQELGISQAEILKVTESINKTLVISGASAASASAALVQFGQGLGAGALRGEELNSVLEQAPRLAKALADGLGVPIAALREMGQAGELTSEKIFEALGSQAAAIEAEFQRMPTTVSQALQVAENRFQQFIGRVNESSGATKSLISVIDGLSKSIDVLAGVAAGFVATKIAQVILSIGTSAAQSVASIGAQTAALQASKLATLDAASAVAVKARADVAAAASALAAAKAREQELRASVLAASGAVQVAIAQNGLIPAIARTTAASAAYTAALQAQTAATTALTAANGAYATSLTASYTAGALAARAIGFLGGPIGAISTVLGIGASAWALWSLRASDAEKNVSGSIETSTREMVSNLDEQIKKLQERNRLISGASDIARDPSKEAQRAATLLSEAAALRAAGGGPNEISAIEKEAAAAEIQRKLRQKSALEDALKQKSALEDLADVRRRLAGIDKQYFDDLAKYQRALKEGAITEKEYIREVSELAKKAYGQRAKAKEKEVTEAQRYMESLRTQLQSTRDLSVEEKLLEDIQAGRLGKVTALQQQSLVQTARQIDAIRRQKEEERDALKIAQDRQRARNQEYDDAIKAVQANEKATKDRLASLLDNTPSKVLEKQRQDVEFLTRAYTELKDENGQALLTEEQYLEAVSARLNLTADKITKTKTVAEELGLTFASAFEDAIVSGKKLSDVLGGLAQDIMKIFVRKTITEPIGGFFSDLFGGFSFGSLFGGRAIGGPVSAGGIYQVNERGPEMLSVAGKEYLMMGNQSGKVSPGVGSSVNIVQNFTVGDVATVSRLKAEIATANSALVAQLSRRTQTAW